MKLRQLQQRADRLGFCPQPAVRWLSPGELWRVAVKVTLSWVFANYSDKREIQESLPAAVIDCPGTGDDRSELWFDFVADVGDGFDATYTVASLIAQEKLAVDGLEADARSGSALPRASLLVFGGDEIYPTASERAYEDRTKGPYRAALPRLDNPPLLVALPGNHDWYDGLTAFLRVFAQKRFIGAWRTAQSRSYFAVRLPHRWWLLGVDTQLGSYIDEPQLRFFREHVSTALQPGDGVILCAPAPFWVATGEGDADAFNSLHYFDRQVVRSRTDPVTGKRVETGASIRLWISGDSHHYVRFEEDGAGAGGPGQPVARQLITCGLGGAYVSTTHALPERLELPPPGSRLRSRDEPAGFRRRGVFPDPAASRRLSFGLLWPGRHALPFRNPGFWPVAGLVQTLLFFALSYVLGLVQRQPAPAAIRGAGPEAALAVGGWFLVALAITALLVTLSAVPARLRGRPARRPGWGFVATALQLVVATGGLAAAAAVPWPGGWPHWAVLVCCLLGTLVGTGLVASFAFAAYIRLARGGLAEGWQMSAQSIEDFKGFVRMHIDPEGQLTVYPICVPQVCHDWTVEPDGGTPGGERPVPRDHLPRPRLIEPPVAITRRPGPAPAVGPRQSAMMGT